jgi:pimeloyl-ACP methyl ester carboxylesterase
VSEVRRRTIDLDGQAVAYREAGRSDAPVVILLHGLASDSGTWELAIEPLAARGLRVIAPDLIGHGDSAKPALGYSLERFACFLRDLMDRLDVPSATIAGHSLGGAIAMHFGYHYPRYVDRLVLVASGGLGRSVHPLLRAATLPGARGVVRLLVNKRTAVVYRAPRLHRTLRLPPGTVTNLRRAGRGLANPDGRAAFFATLHSVIQPSGQRGSMIEMQYLGQHVPTLIVWTERDHVIPVSHAYATHEHLPTSRLEIFPGTSHELHRRFADRFAEVVADFVATTEPAVHPS